MNIKKFEKLVPNLRDRNEYLIHIRNARQALNHGLVLKKVQRAIKFNQKAWLKSYTEMNTELKKSKKWFWKIIFQVENIKYRGNKLVTTEKRRNYLASEPHYHSTKIFTKNLLAIEMRKTQTYINKPVYLGLLILELRKMVMYEFWYDYIKPKYK